MSSSPAPGKTVLLTGGTGFIGSRLAAHLLASGYAVHLVIRPDSNLQQVKSFASSAHLHAYDGATLSLIDLVRNIRPDTVFHLASLFIAEHTSENVEPLIASNILFGTQLLEAMRVNGVTRLVNAGTAWQHFHSATERPSCLYAATKRAFQDLLDFYCDAYSFRAITLKIFDTYGPADPRRKLFRVLYESAQSQSPAPLPFSAGDQQIDLVYIDDVVNAFLIASERLASSTAPASSATQAASPDPGLSTNPATHSLSTSSSHPAPTANSATIDTPASPAHEIYGLTSGHPRSLREVVELYQKILSDSGGPTFQINWGARPHRAREVMRAWPNPPTLPGWTPKISLTEGLSRLT